MPDFGATTWSYWKSKGSNWFGIPVFIGSLIFRLAL